MITLLLLSCNNNDENQSNNVEEKSVKEEIEKKINGSFFINNTCFVNITKEINITNITNVSYLNKTCNVSFYNIVIKHKPKRWEVQTIRFENGSIIKREFFVKEYEIYSKEPFVFCVLFKLRFIKHVWLDYYEELNSKDVVLAITPNSVTTYKYLWFTKKDLSYDYILEPIKVINKSECINFIINQSWTSKQKGIIRNKSSIIENVEGCFKYINITKIVNKTYKKNVTKTVKCKGVGE